MEFRHLVRVAATELKGKSKLKLALTKIKGVGPSIANATLKKLGMDPDKLVGDCTDEEFFKIEEFLKSSNFPVWMMNRKKDPFTGEDTHLISIDLNLANKKDKDFMKKIKSYRGMRHAFGLKVRGQRTKSTGRRGKTVGVSRKQGKKGLKVKK